VLVDPHLYAYDLVLLVPAFLLLWDWVLAQPERRMSETFVAQTFLGPPTRGAAFSFSSVFLWLLYLCYLSPLFVTLADVARLQLSPLLLGLLGVVILGVLRSNRSLDVELRT
jgi:hypothetical protein